MAFNMDKIKKQDRYQRIYDQLKELLPKSDDTLARMSTVIAVLHHKIDYFFWTGYYFLKNDSLIVGPYQGPVACQKLKKGKGVCWTGIERQEPVIVPDVEQFPGHIACDSRSRSEIVIPLRNANDEITGVMDIDSKKTNSFDKTDEHELSRIIRLIYES